MPRRSGSATPSAMQRRRRPSRPGSPSRPSRRSPPARTRAPGRCSPAGSAAGTRSRRREQDRVRLRVREERAPVPGGPAVHERRAAAAGPRRRAASSAAPRSPARLARSTGSSARRGTRCRRSTSSLNEVNRRHPARSWSNRASSGGWPCAWCVVHTTEPPSAIAHFGLVTSSPMNASPRHRSSTPPSSEIRPHAVPVPSQRAYQSDSSSIHSTRPTVCSPGHGSVVVPSARSTIMTLPLSSPGSLE